MLPRPPRSTLFPYTTPFPSLASRHLELEVVLPLGLGYAPRSNALLDAMKGLGVRDAVLLEAGLLSKREDGPMLPRLPGRPPFPIRRHPPRARALGWRLLGGRQ